MADEMKMKKAVEMYGVLCKALDERNWHYQKEEDKLTVRFSVTGDDLSMRFGIAIDADRALFRLFSWLPFEMQERRTEGALACCYINNRLVDGCFAYKMEDGSVLFRMVASYRDSLIGTGLVAYLIDCACGTVDKYNDKFLMLEKGKLEPEDFKK